MLPQFRIRSPEVLRSQRCGHNNEWRGLRPLQKSIPSAVTNFYKFFELLREYRVNYGAKYRAIVRMFSLKSQLLAQFLARFVCLAGFWRERRFYAGEMRVAGTASMVDGGLHELKT